MRILYDAIRLGIGGDRLSDGSSRRRRCTTIFITVTTIVHAYDRARLKCAR